MDIMLVHASIIGKKISSLARTIMKIFNFVLGKLTFAPPCIHSKKNQYSRKLNKSFRVCYYRKLAKSFRTQVSELSETHQKPVDMTYKTHSSETQKRFPTYQIPLQNQYLLNTKYPARKLSKSF